VDISVIIGVPDEVGQRLPDEIHGTIHAVGVETDPFMGKTDVLQLSQVVVVVLSEKKVHESGRMVFFQALQNSVILQRLQLFRLICYK
jgi:hypothetical protein